MGAEDHCSGDPLTCEASDLQIGLRGLQLEPDRLKDGLCHGRVLAMANGVALLV